MKRTLLALFIFTFLLAACGTPAPTPVSNLTARSANSGGAPPVEAPVMQQPASPAFSSESQATDSSSVGTASGSQQTVDTRIVIKNANLTLVVKTPDTSLNAIAKMAEGMGGYVVSSNLDSTYTSNGDKVPSGSIVIRVPADKLDTAIEQIEAGAIEVQSESRSGQDVTKDYIDLQSRLQNLEVAQKQLNQIMQQATKTQDVLAVYQQLVSTNEQIEVLKGQIKYYDESAAFSAITIQLTAESSLQPIEVGGWKPQGVARDALQALINFFQGFGSFLIWLVLFIIPVSAVLIVLLALVWRLLRWFWRKVFPKKSPPEATS